MGNQETDDDSWEEQEDHYDQEYEDGRPNEEIIQFNGEMTKTPDWNEYEERTRPGERQYISTPHVGRFDTA